MLWVEVGPGGMGGIKVDVAIDKYRTLFSLLTFVNVIILYYIDKQLKTEKEPCSSSEYTDHQISRFYSVSVMSTKS